MGGLRRLLDWIGGGVSRMAASGFAGGFLFVFLGMTPAEAVAYLFKNPPDWLMSGWTRLLLVIVGLAVIFTSHRFNLWSQRQKAIDDISEDISWAISEILNRARPKALADYAAFAQQLKIDYEIWCARVSKKLENRAFFTRSDQLHFDRLGFVDPVQMTGDNSADHTLSMLKLKFERVREIINWIQQRPR